MRRAGREAWSLGWLPALCRSMFCRVGEWGGSLASWAPSVPSVRGQGRRVIFVGAGCSESRLIVVVLDVAAIRVDR
jgi:hypothetical protein